MNENKFEQNTSINLSQKDLRGMISNPGRSVDTKVKSNLTAETTAFNNSKSKSETSVPVPAKAFDDLEYYMISNTIIFNALRKYVKTFSKALMPYSFVNFFFREISKYERLQSQHLKEFFVVYKKKPKNFENSIFVFTKAFPTYAKIKRIQKPSFFLGTKKGDYLEINRAALLDLTYYKADNNKELLEALDSIKCICDNINKNNEIRDFSTRYAEFVEKEPQIEIEAKQEPDPTVERNLAISGNRPQSSEKITPLVIPKFRLPSPYPKSFEVSRVDSQRIANNFFSSERLLKIVNKYKIVGVMYSNYFCDKRNTLISPKKKNQFDDFF